SFEHDLVGKPVPAFPDHALEHVMLTAAGQAFREMFTPPFRAVLFKCVGFTIALLVLLIVGLGWTFSHFVQWPGWIETTIEWLGGPVLVGGSTFSHPAVNHPLQHLSQCGH